MLKVEAILPRVRALEVLIEPIHALAEVCQRAKGGTSWRKDAAMERVRQRVVGSEIIVLGGDQGCCQTEAVLTAGLVGCLGETAHAATDDRVRQEPIGETYARPELLVV